MRFVVALFCCMLTVQSAPALELITQSGKSPLITIRVVFQSGSAHDPAGKEGLASLAAAMVADAGTKSMEYQQIIEALYPLATEISWQVDKEMTTFSAETHADNLEKVYSILREMILDPGWRDSDLTRLKDDAVNYLRVSLRGNNDEELGKEVLYNEIYSGHPYGHHNMGTVSAIQKLTAANLKAFHKRHYTQANLTIAVAGGYPAGFPDRLRNDFAKLPKGSKPALKLPAPKTIDGRNVLLVEKPGRSVAISLGFPINVKRGHPDYPALLLAQSWLGQHRSSGVHLYDRIREERGLNYGDYAYIEYFPRGMFQFEPDPNLARQQQIFQVWIRPVVPDTSHFTMRVAMFELDKLFTDGISEDAFQRTRNFLTKYVNLLTKTKRAEMGYAIDSRFYGITDYNTYLKQGLAKLTRDDVNQAIRRHLPMKNMQIVMIAENVTDLKNRISGEAPSPMKYNSPKPKEILEEDKMIEMYPLKIPSGKIRTVKFDTLFE